MADWRRKYEELRDAVRALLRQQDLAGSPAADRVEDLVRRRVFVACGSEDEGGSARRTSLPRPPGA